MTKKSTHSVRAFISKIVSYAKSQLPRSQMALVGKFIRLFYSQVSMEDLADKSVPELYSIAFSHWQLMQQKKEMPFKIKIFNPKNQKDGWSPTHSIIQIAVNDMPFLVDSVQMELNRLGITVHLMIFMGGMRILRNKTGIITDILPYDVEQENSVIESPIYMEIDRITDSNILEEMRINLERVLGDADIVVKDWNPMRERLKEILTDLSTKKLSQKESVIKETIAFLQWILSDHFTFLGARDYKIVTQEEGTLALKLVKGSGLGVLRDETKSKVFRQYSELPKKAREIALSHEQILLISKTNTRSTVHRPAYTDYIGVKVFNDEGKLVGERRFIGLYTSAAYSSSPKHIPFLRHKVDSVMKKSGLPYKSHAGKKLLHLLTTLPRDDLFHASTEELFRLAIGILHMQDRRKIRFFARKDPYGRFVSCLAYVPRENFNTELISKMLEILKVAFDALEISFTTHFTESVLARVHYMIRIDPKKKLSYDVQEIEERLREVGKSWHDVFRESVIEYFGEEHGNKLIRKYIQAFPAGYREEFIARKSVFDIEQIEKLTSSYELTMTFYRPPESKKGEIKFKLYHLESTIPLSDTLPMLENMGLRVIGEVPYEIRFSDNKVVWINDFVMSYATDTQFEVEQVKDIFQQAFYKVWLGEAENDEFNRLVLEAQLNWREISVLRAYTKYLRQTGFSFSPQYITSTFVNNPKLAVLLIKLFKHSFDPELAKDFREKPKYIIEEIEKELDNVAILDEDRIIRHCCKLIQATLRTNYFQKDNQGDRKKYISFKFNPKKVPELPLPLPRYEIFVYSPRFEGIHLRAGKVARGGIRWSDRREDFRTEVLGLMKAQQVKNSVIVPAGAKGGFVVKALPVDADREQILEEGVHCYSEFIQGLLDLTDNLKGDKVIHPKNTICYDDDDPYLVVAADKGTATFSDIANNIAVERNYWLGDAFASGGSIGYDHKKMGITARGAWISAERHFQELGINVDHTEITVIGIGDMSGDVFGNGLLMSRFIKLVAGFNHQHIFLDPDPNPSVSYEERMRLFKLPRSTWKDYNEKLISPGGGVFERTMKAIKISPPVKQLLKINKDALVPNELIKAILTAQVDLLWNGGVGTFIKASVESHDDAGDRSNDAIRVNGNEIRARVVCEGGNLGFTQLARIEYELNGGRVNTDFIDNSAGVDCSDHEVNIKILLNSLVAEKKLTTKQRNALLSRMTNEVAELVLQDNYHQNQTISLACYMAPRHMNLLIRYIDEQEKRKKLNRILEYIPDDKALLERKAEGRGLTRPEMAVLLAYSKIILEEKIRKSDLPFDPYLSQFVKNAFPTHLRKRYVKHLMNHRLAKEIISTQVSNNIVSNMGITFVYQMYDETGASISAIVRAYAAAYDILHMAEIIADIESLDYKVDITMQYQMFEEVRRLVRRAARWLLRNRRGEIDIQQTIDQFSPGVITLFKRLPKLLKGSHKDRFETSRDRLITANVPDEIAWRIASAEPMSQAFNIIEAAVTHNIDSYQVAKIYFMMVDRLDLLWFRDLINSFAVDDHWSVLARASYKGDLDWIQRQLTMGILQIDTSLKSITDRLNAWQERHAELIARWENIITELKSTEKKEFTMLAVAVRELADLSEVCFR